MAAQSIYGARAETPPWQVTWEGLGARVVLHIETGGRQQLNPGLEVDNSAGMRSYVALRDPADMVNTGHHRLRSITREMDVDVRSRMQMRSMVDAFHLTVELAVQVDVLPHFTRRWVKSVPRRLL